MLFHVSCILCVKCNASHLYDIETEIWKPEMEACEEIKTLVLSANDQIILRLVQFIIFKSLKCVKIQLSVFRNAEAYLYIPYPLNMPYNLYSIPHPLSLDSLWDLKEFTKNPL